MLSVDTSQWLVHSYNFGELLLTLLIFYCSTFHRLVFTVVKSLGVYLFSDNISIGTIETSKSDQSLGKFSLDIDRQVKAYNKECKMCNLRERREKKRKKASGVKKKVTVSFVIMKRERARGGEKE